MLTSSPRLLAIGLAASAVTFAATGCGSDEEGGSSTAASGATGGSVAGKSIVFETFGGKFDSAIKKFYVDPTTEASGLEIKLDSPTDYSKLLTQVKTDNVQWSVVMGDPFYAVQNCGKTLQPVDKLVDRAALDPKFVVSACSVPADQFSYTLMYDTKKFGANPPTGWKDFFDTKTFPGKRGIFSGYVFNGMLEGASLADGVPQESLYPLDIDRAIKKLETIKSETNFFDSLAAGQQLMEAEEVGMIVLPQENGLYAEQNGADFTPVWSQQVTSWNDYIVPKGADPTTAAALLKTIASPAAQNAIAGAEPVGVSLKDQKAATPSEDVAKWSPLVEDRAATQVVVDQKWWAENLEAAESKWTAFVAG